MIEVFEFHAFCDRNINCDTIIQAIFVSPATLMTTTIVITLTRYFPLSCFTFVVKRETPIISSDAPTIPTKEQLTHSTHCATGPASFSQ